MRSMGKIPGALIAGAVFLFPLAASASSVDYMFSGDVTGVLEGPVPDRRQTIAAIQFQVDVFGDTNAVQYLGYEASDGPSAVNNSSYTTWTVSGLGTASTNTAEVYVSPELAEISLDWNETEAFRQRCTKAQRNATSRDGLHQGFDFTPRGVDARRQAASPVIRTAVAHFS